MGVLVWNAVGVVDGVSAAEFAPVGEGSVTWGTVVVAVAQSVGDPL